MPHAQREPRRLRVTPAAQAPEHRLGHGHRKLLVLAGAALSMIVIFGLYAATFKSRIAALRAEPDLPRWSVSKGSFSEEVKPFAEGLEALRAEMQALVGASEVQAEGIGILKEKLEASASSTVSATASPEHPNEPQP